MAAKQLSLDLAPEDPTGAAAPPLAPRVKLPVQREPSGLDTRNVTATLAEMSGKEPTMPLAAAPVGSPDWWQAWISRPHTPENRLDDLVLQIRRDMAVLKEDKSYHPDDSFYLERIEGCRAEAQKLAAKIGGARA